ncbi:MAG: hypothetical protein ACRDF6_07885, partial [bacterium]
AGRVLRAAHGSNRGDSAHAGTIVPLMWLLVVAGIGLVDNPFAAVTFLLLPSLLWIWISSRSRALSRVVNAILIVCGFGVLVLLFVQYAAGLRVGWYILWYMFMAIAYGQFMLLRTILALATVAIALRLLAKGTINLLPQEAIPRR